MGASTASSSLRIEEQLAHMHNSKLLAPPVCVNPPSDANLGMPFSVMTANALISHSSCMDRSSQIAADRNGSEMHGSPKVNLMKLDVELEKLHAQVSEDLAVVKNNMDASLANI